MELGYTFQMIFIPRKRLNKMLEDPNFKGIVVGVSPTWFKDKSESKYLWLPNIYSDRDEFISNPLTPFEFEGIDSLENKTIGMVAGHYYFGVSEAIKEGRLQKVDTIGDLQVLELIDKHRVDFGIVSLSVLRYLNKTERIRQHFHFSNAPHDVFSRRAFMALNQTKLHKTLVPIISRMHDDPNWLTIVKKYQ